MEGREILLLLYTVYCIVYRSKQKYCADHNGICWDAVNPVLQQRTHPCSRSNEGTSTYIQVLSQKRLCYLLTHQLHLDRCLENRKRPSQWSTAYPVTVRQHVPSSRPNITFLSIPILLPSSYNTITSLTGPGELSPIFLEKQCYRTLLNSTTAVELAAFRSLFWNDKVYCCVQIIKNDPNNLMKVSTKGT